MSNSSATKIMLWSSPRNISTALMYSFAQREDTSVMDEPFYAYYLKKKEKLIDVCSDTPNYGANSPACEFDKKIRFLRITDIIKNRLIFLIKLILLI